MSFRFLWLKGHALIALIFTIVCFSNRPRRLGYNESPLHPDSSHLYKRAPKRLIGKFCPRHATSRATIASGPTTRTNAHSCAVLRKKTEKRDRERARERERERERGDFRRADCILAASISLAVHFLNCGANETH